jgi:Tfp pilus assembly protein PilO
MEMMLWNVLLSLLLTGIGWVLKEKSAELQRIQVLVNRTREEMAKEYVTKQEMHADINRVLDRLDRLDEKLDRLMGTKHAS